MDKKIIILAVAILAALAGYAAWRGMGGFYSPSIAPEAGLQQSTTAGTEQAAGSGEQSTIKEVTVRATEFAFTPNELSVKPGQTVRLTFVNEGSSSHNFVIEKLGVQTKFIASGHADTIQFSVPSDAGNFPITAICTVPGHKEAGMVFTFNLE